MLVAAQKPCWALWGRVSSEGSETPPHEQHTQSLSYRIVRDFGINLKPIRSPGNVLERPAMVGFGLSQNQSGIGKVIWLEQSSQGMGSEGPVGVRSETAVASSGR